MNILSSLVSSLVSIIKAVIEKLELDAQNFLKFMASNDLVANPSKTTLMILNYKSDEPVSIKIGDSTIYQDTDAKLLGVNISENQKWTKQISGTNGVISALNQRNYLIRRLANHVNKEQLKKVADSIWTSKLRYGLQLYGPVRKSNLDPQSCELEKLQIAQNNMLRNLENVRVKDKVSIKSLLDKNQMLSVNQTMAQIKLTEMWKSKNILSYPLHPPTIQPILNGATTRSASSEKFIINCTPNTFVGDATRIWNQAPKTITDAISIKTAKTNVKLFCNSLPI